MYRLSSETLRCICCESAFSKAISVDRLSLIDSVILIVILDDINIQVEHACFSVSLYKLFKVFLPRDTMLARYMP